MEASALARVLPSRRAALVWIVAALVLAPFARLLDRPAAGPSFVRGSESADMAAVVCLCIFVMAFAVSLGPLPYVLMSELFPLALRGPGMGIALAWFHDADTGTYLHNGATAGYTGDASFNPKGDYAAIVLSNTGPGSIISADLIGDHIRSRLTGKPAISVSSIVVPASGGVLGAIRLFAVYWITMLAMGSGRKA